jgi:hypothetical protein
MTEIAHRPDNDLTLTRGPLDGDPGRSANDRRRFLQLFQDASGTDVRAPRTPRRWTE